MSFAHSENLQGTGTFIREASWEHRALFNADGAGHYNINMVDLVANRPLTQTLFLSTQSCLRPAPRASWACADRSVDGQIADAEDGWLRDHPFLLTPNLALRITATSTQRLGARLIDLFTVDPGSRWEPVLVAVDRASDTVVAIAYIAITLTQNNIWVMRYADWNDPTAIVPARVTAAVPLPAVPSESHESAPQGSFGSLWPLVLSPTVGQRAVLATAFDRVAAATTAALTIHYTDTSGPEGQFDGHLFATAQGTNLSLLGSANSTPPVDVAVTPDRECVSRTGQGWSCLSLLTTTRYPVLDTVGADPLLKAERPGSVLFAGTTTIGARLVDEYVILNDVSRVITVDIDRQSGTVSSVLVRQNTTSYSTVRIDYSDWNDPAITFPALPATTAQRRSFRAAR